MQGSGQQGAKVDNVPARLSGALEDFLPAYTESPWQIFLGIGTYDASCSQLSSFDASETSIPRRGPVEQAKIPDQEPMGPFGDRGASGVT